MRKTYGNTWWGKQWLNALTHIDNSNRLPRGRSYTNKGAARDIEITNSQITAKVKDSRSRPYSIDISIPSFTANEKAKIIEVVTGNPIYLSKLAILLRLYKEGDSFRESPSFSLTIR